MKVGIIGTGAIGLPIAERIIDGGFELNFYARRQEVIDSLCEKGAVFCKSVEALGAKCDVVLLFVNTFDQCVECTEELLKSMNGGIIAVGATISPKQMAQLQKLCDKKNVAAIACPVTGGVKGAREGTLTIILSGDAKAVGTLTPCFETFGKKLYMLGEEIGRAHIMKSLVQLLVGINTVATAEVLMLGKKSGLDPEKIYETICNSAGTSRIFENRACTMIEGDFHRRGTVSILQKDLKISKELALDNNVPLLLGDAVSRLFGIGAQMLDCTEDCRFVNDVGHESWKEIQWEKES